MLRRLAATCQVDFRLRRSGFFCVHSVMLKQMLSLTKIYNNSKNLLIFLLLSKWHYSPIHTFSSSIHLSQSALTLTSPPKLHFPFINTSLYTFPQFPDVHSGTCLLCWPCYVRLYSDLLRAARSGYRTPMKDFPHPNRPTLKSTRLISPRV